MEELKRNSEFEGLGLIFSQKKKEEKKPPAYQWQDFALKIIKELNIPAFKRNSVFKICRDNSKEFLQICLNDTKELCQTGEKWKYFFKIAANKGKFKG